ncbi:hypothetical protein CPJCM30710_01670 [Clostridium polyendosporum]|uniref:Uncharacterized protein n=1 Tax=Clostridium polyendosporum TaxID=69208 RepID=A0A919RW55_9CLOT|nr:hypothetical protein CPJCM30710_01670 [Clostridium polyendosporum]
MNAISLNKLIVAQLIKTVNLYFMYIYAHSCINMHSCNLLEKNTLNYILYIAIENKKYRKEIIKE